MFKLISKANTLPKSLFITDIKMLDSETVGFGGFGRVLKGHHDGQHVAMKVLYKVQVGAFFAKMSPQYRLV